MAALFLFNRPPASIYSGDAGSLTIGYLLGYCWLDFARREGVVASAPTLFLLAVPLGEVALLIAGRLPRGLSPFRPSPDHFFLRLRAQQGWSRPRILMATVGVAAALTSAPAATIASTSFGAAYLSACVVGIFAVFWLCWRLYPPTR